MEEARVLGTVVATSIVDSLRGRKLVWIQPVESDGSPRGNRLVAVDTTQAGRGTRVYFVRSREAAEALTPSFAPVDAAVLGIVDQSRVAPAAVGGAPFEQA
ncbi:MAG: EutN/CcmL family microcompartment protein [Candidatus Eisenbacteria bacterium]